MSGGFIGVELDLGLKCLSPVISHASRGPLTGLVGKTAPGKGPKSIRSVLKLFFHMNSLLHLSDSGTGRGFAFLTRIAVLSRSLTAMCTDGV